MDANQTQFQYYGALSKEAGIGDYLSAAGRGADVGTNNGSWLMSPINAAKGAYKGILGHVANKETAGLQQQGVAFNKDPYGRIKDVDIGGSIKNFTSNVAGPAIGNFLGSAASWAGDNKMLLGGIGSLAGGYMLKNMMFPGQPKPQYSVPRQYTQGMMAPQSFEKGAGFDFMPSPMALPQAMAGAMVNGISIPGMGGSDDDEYQRPVQQPYQPNIQSENPKLQKMLKDPRMRDYLTRLISQSR